MRPIAIEIEGLRSFRDGATARIEFGDRDLVAIVGETGAGKSSILEALTYALYGQASFAAHANQELMNDESERLRVAVDFWAGEQQWLAVRELERRKDGEVGPATALLERIGKEGQRLESIEGVQQVNRRVIGLLGLDAPAFLRTVVLPQGRFARLLVEDDPRQRAAILRQIWDTSDIEATAEVVRHELGRLATLETRCETYADTLPDNPQEEAERLAATAVEAAAATERARAAEARAAKAVAKAAEAKKAEERARQAQAQAAAIDVKAVEAAMTAGRDRLAATKQACAEAADALRKADRQVARIAEQETPDLEAIDKAVARAAAAGDTLDEADAASKRADLAEREAADAEAVSEAARGKVEAAGKAAQAARAAHREAAAAAATAERRAEEAERCAREVTRARSRAAAGAEKELASARRRDEARRASAAAARRARESEEERTAAAQRLQKIREADAAAAAAHGHAPGDACPICRQPLPKGWQPPKANGLAAAAVEARRTQENAEAAGRSAAGAAATADAAAKAAEDTAREAKAARAELAAAEQAAELLPGATVANERSDVAAATAVAVRQTAERAERTAEQARERLEKAENAAGAAEREAGLAEGAERARRKEAANQREDAGKAARRSEAAWTAAVVEDGAEARVENAERREWARAQGLKMRERQADARAIAREQQACVQEAARRRLALNAAEERAREVSEQTKREMQQQFQTATAALARVAELAGTAPPLPDTGCTAAEVLAAVHRGIEQTHKAAGETAAAAGESLESARAELLQAVREAEGGENRPSTPNDEAVRWCRARTEASAGRAAVAAEAAAAAAATAPAAERLSTVAAQVRVRRGQLSEIALSLKSGAFPKWLTLRRSVDLLRHGAVKLEEMTGGRYSFRDPRDTEERWRIVDRQSGATRAPTTLSGGEQFLASLSLALGLVETLGRRGGHLEALFLDEGFGSLDQKALDMALDGLEAAATAEHLVGVITHVRQVAERIPHVLAVEHEPGRGSTARWLDNAERVALGEGLTDGLTSVS